MSDRKLLLHAALCSIILSLLLGCSPAAEQSASSGAAPHANAPAFSGDRAFDLLKQQVALGPRVPNTPGHKAGADFILQRVRKYADLVAVQSFTHTTRGKTLEMQNIVARFNPQAKTAVLLLAHWDTRPTADSEVTPEKRAQPIPGANDGASGTAVLLEMARVFAAQKPDVGVVMVFVDGEDYGPGEPDMFLGAKEFAKDVSANAAAGGKPVSIRYGILVDMVGDKDLKIPEEGESLKAAPDVVRKVWGTASKLGYGKTFIPEQGYSISDDHLPIIEAGIKCIDVIDFDYGPWHTLDDTPDKCSPDSLKAVGDVVSAVIYAERPS